MSHSPSATRTFRIAPGLADAANAVQKLACRSLPVILIGETGSGKEALAELLHNQSDRSNGPYVPISIRELGEGNAALSALLGHVRGAFTGAVNARQGYVQAADGGTLFLDEIDKASAEVQSLLLRMLDGRPFRPFGADPGSAPVTANFRLVSATSSDLELAVHNGRFLADLYYRIANCPIHVPALRQRRADIPFLVGIFVDELRLPVRFSPEAIDLLAAQTWPGNVRQLKHTVEALASLVAPEAVVSASAVRTFFKGQTCRSPADTDKLALQTADPDQLRRRALQANNSIAAAARSLGVSRQSLWKYCTATSNDGSPLRPDLADLVRGLTATRRVAASALQLTNQGTSH